MTKEEFEKQYNELCEKAGFHLAFEPYFKMEDDGTFTLRYRYVIVSNSETL